ncbi:hypothetical protein [Clostridium malenominatum]|uniref:hypothetical protein n=1 Tax=Clostridium malenominatum TaxID=1539 RepID=UPI0031DAC13C
MAEEKTFLWSYDGQKIVVLKEFKSGKEYKYVFSNSEINKILSYIEKSGKVSLANSVSKLQDGTEKEGIGKYIYDNINKDSGVAQTASQLVAIFYNANVLYYNNKKKGMEFWINNINWQERILNFMHERKSIK